MENDLSVICENLRQAFVALGRSLSMLRKSFVRGEAMVGHRVYPHIIPKIIRGDIDLATAYVYVTLMKPGFVFSVRHVYFSRKFECDSQGYPMGGQPLPIKHYNLSSPINICADIENTVFTKNGSFVSCGAVIYAQVGNKRPQLVSFVDFGGVEWSSGGTFEVSWGEENRLIKIEY